jgi:hypothetical protein
MARVRWPWHGSSRRSGAPGVDPDEIKELLEKVQQLRMTLTADLSAAAGALDADEPEVARDIIAADRVELHRIAAPPVPAQRSAAPRRRILIALPAIPLVGALAITGAAALTSGSSHHPTAGRSVVTAINTPAAIQQTAATTLHQLERVVAHHHGQRQVVTVAAQLHHQLTALITTAPHDATQLGEVQRLLSVEQQLLESHRGEGTAIALAASRHLNKLLAAAGLPTVLPSSLPPVAAKPTKNATTSPPPKATPSKTATVHPSTTPTSVVSARPTPSHSPTPKRHAHHHHRHLTNPLFGDGLLNHSL